MKEQVDHPEHYNQGNIECIDAMLASKGTSSVINFCILNAFKYVWRAGCKDSLYQDLEKAIWYLTKAKELLKK